MAESQVVPVDEIAHDNGQLRAKARELVRYIIQLHSNVFERVIAMRVLYIISHTATCSSTRQCTLVKTAADIGFFVTEAGRMGTAAA